MKRLDFFDKHADAWDFKKADQEKIKFVVDMMHLKKRSSVLDIGCGTGVLLPFLSAKVGAKGSVTALDFSKNMLDKVRLKYGNLYDYVHADIENTSFDDFMFDAVVCFSCFPHFAHKQRALNETYRILKNEGILFILHSTSRKDINAFHHKIGGAVCHDMLPNERRMRLLCEQAGFESVCIIDEKNYYFLSAQKR